MADRARLAKRPIMPPKRREFTWKMESSRGSWKVEVVCQPTKEGRKQGNSQSPNEWIEGPVPVFPQCLVCPRHIEAGQHGEYAD